MAYITLSTAVSITGLSKRTLWRRIADQHLRTQASTDQGEHARVLMGDVMAISRLKLKNEDRELIVDADAGVAQAQCDLALEFLIQNLPAEAVHWLTLAANQSYPEAMHQLGRCYIAGQGVEANESIGVEWISRAAALGHSTAKYMTRYLMDPARPAFAPAALEGKLDKLERGLVLKALQDTADPA